MKAKKNFNPINPELALNLGNQRPSDEQMAELAKINRRQARNQLAAGFAQIMVQSQGSNFCATEVVERAYELAEALLEKSAELDKRDPINESLLASLTLARQS